jgi:UDP-N-acetylglucosamine 2-epimerase (non-hydrolysing)
MSKTLKILIIAGARPNFMKVAPIIKRIGQNPVTNGVEVEYRLVHTGQHYDEKMSDMFFSELGIPAPDINLGVGCSGSHAVQTANVMTKFETVCEKEKPDWILVAGDLNSTMPCTLVGAKLNIKVAHVEAGLRNFDRSVSRSEPPRDRCVGGSLADTVTRRRRKPEARGCPSQRSNLSATS